ncbi:PrpF domain-containing protein [Streptomyces sp. BE308]|uniref:PrpF domain-containing protein n=1 Tax=Streptomyces sp. BE308 TaxID=3002529 RepID=UPI002E7A9B63|nr:PrpF domain-containing protein [Streptomyces sp. BE308]MEE1791178.1 PrpF domain-containing protein [Streptomyces sp. BE308]
MIGHLAYAVGSPCPTFVLDAARLPREEAALLGHLTEARRFLASAGGAHVLKIALVEPSAHPMFDLDYRFVQALPGGDDRFDLRGSCGHSVLSAVVAAGRCGMLPRLLPGARIRVRVLNNGDSVVCEVDRVERDEVQFSVAFVQPGPVPFTDLLPTGDTRTVLDLDGGPQEVSLVTSANAYAFVDARTLEVPSPAALFAAGDDLLDRLERIRVAAADRLGWPRGGAFPKIAAIVPDPGGGIAARAVTVPRWHPTIALTGAVCLGIAVRIPQTVPWLLARENGADEQGLTDIETPGGRTTVTAVTSAPDAAGNSGALLWASVARKRVTFQGSFVLAPLSHLQFEEVAQCLALSVAA